MSAEYVPYKEEKNGIPADDDSIVISGTLKEMDETENDMEPLDLEVNFDPEDEDYSNSAEV